MAAAGMYAGAFLDGFHLPGAPEFERWLEAERDKLRSAATAAMETCAARAVDAGAVDDAMRWWRRLGELDPYSARYAAGSVRALMSANDLVAALRLARAYSTRIERELGANVDPGIRQLIAELQRAPVPSPVVSSIGRGVEPPARETVAVMLEPARMVRRSLATPFRAALLVTSVAVAVLGWRYTRSTGPSGPPVLAVGSIRVSDTIGGGPILRDMLATNLARIPGIRVLANSRLFELAPRASDSVPGALTDAARRAAADEILEGEIRATTGGLVLALRRVDLRTGVLRGGYTVTAATRVSVIDSATAAIARDFDLSPPRDAVTSVRTASPAAYALYEEGLRAYHLNDAPAAYRLMNAALERDSSFAMAAHYSWLAARGMGREAEADRALEIAERLASRTIDRERLLILGEAAGRNASIAEYVRRAKQLTARYPDDPEGQMLLGSAQFTAGDWRASVTAYERAFALDSSAGLIRGPFCRVCNEMIAMSHSLMWNDSAAAAERAGRRLVSVLPEESLAWGSLIEPLLRQNRWVDAQSAMARSSALSLTRSDFDPVVNRGLIRSGRYSELDLKLWSSVMNSSGNGGEAGWLLGISLRNQGRLREARELAEHGVVPGSTTRITGPPDPTAIAIVAFESGRPRESARIFLDRAEADQAGTDAIGLKARTITWHLTLAGTSLAAAGDTSAVHRLADSVERVALLSRFGRDARLHHFLRGLLYQYEGRHSDAVDAFRRSLFSLTDGYTRTNLEMARSLMVLRRYKDAVAVLQPALRGGVDGSNAYITHTELHEALAQAFEGAGNADSATVHYAAVEAAWRSADPAFRLRYLRAKSRTSASRPATLPARAPRHPSSQPGLRKL